MFRNQYDQDVLTWSPQGRIHQVEYAMEAVKQGGAAVGCKNADYVVLATLKRAASELSSSQRKLFKIDDNVGIAISGLTADGTAATKALRGDCITHKFTFESQVDVGRLAARVADKSQINTQRAGSRPSGVGMLIAGIDEQGCHLYQTCPSGNLYNHLAAAIGARSQASKTYLEKNVGKLEGLSLDELVMLALRALKEASADPISEKTCSVAVVGKDTPFRLLESDDLSTILEGLAEMD
uniref:Proteasome subunit alpha type n=1 Tax=Mantoniella antarctica TaxID=81844 RepID=A0A7S0X3B0_9CHLO